MKTPLRVGGSDTTVRILDADGKTLATVNKNLKECDYGTAKEIVRAVNSNDELFKACEAFVAHQNGYNVDGFKRQGDDEAACARNWRVVCGMARNAIASATRIPF